MSRVHSTLSSRRLRSNLFDTLPIEMNQRIAKYLDTDTDICNYRLICGSTWRAVDGDNCTFWRFLFLARYDKPRKRMSNEEMKEAYKERKEWLVKGANFKRSDNIKEHERIDQCCLMLRELILDSFTDKPLNGADLTYESKNMPKVHTFIASHGMDVLFQRGRTASSLRHTSTQQPDSLFSTLQVLLAPRIISLASPAAVYDFPTTQEYAYASAAAVPIFGGYDGQTVNMTWCLHQINFWKYHMTRHCELTLFNAFDNLASTHRPRFWSAPLAQASPQSLGRRWKGAYSFVDRAVVGRIRAGAGQFAAIQDEFNGEMDDSAFQDLVLAPARRSAGTWPRLFEEILKSLAPPAPARATTRPRTRAQHSSLSTAEIAAVSASSATSPAESVRFTGSGEDGEEDFLSDGWLTPLPAQQGVPGWQRMTMMKYFVDEYGEVDTGALWAYEGVMLPGGQIVLGRWWCPTDGTGAGMYSGPFVLWCVDGPGGGEGEESGSEEGE